MDWMDQLDDEERRQWDEFVDHFRREALHNMERSAFVAMAAPPDGEFDVKLATEVGAMILLDKPLLAIVTPGTKLSSRLEKAADEVVRVDLDTEDGQRQVAEAIKRLVGDPA